MKNIDTYINFYIKDIIFVLIFTIMISFIWNFALSKKDLSINNIGYTFLNDNVTYYTKAISDEEALLKVETQNILVYNDSTDTGNYDLVLKLSKNEKIDNMKVNVNFIVNNISNYTYFEDNEYFYYILDSKALTKESYKYVVSLWNNESNDNKILDYELLVI